MGGLFFILLISAIVFGAFGSMIANNKGVDGTTGFLLGAFLGPVGCLITVFLSPQQTDDKRSFSPVPLKSAPKSTEPEIQSLENAQYRLWLVSKYAIERNDVLGEVICGEKSFKSVDEALQFADGIEKAKRADAKAKAEEVEAAHAEHLSAEAVALGITFDGEVYQYKSYRYQALKDAVAYAKLGKD